MSEHVKYSLGTQLLRSASDLTEVADNHENLLLAKQQLLAAYATYEGDDLHRTLDHLCLVVEALIQQLRAQK